jgi:hypothetical protein
MNPGLLVGVAALFAILFLHEFFFGEKEIDDRQGFPWSRRRKRK